MLISPSFRSSHEADYLHSQFINMCMLCGCDYLEPIKGVGAKTALKLIKEYDSMEDILTHLRKGKNPPPEDWPWEEAQKLFKTPEVKPSKDIQVLFAPSFPSFTLR